MEEKNTNLCVNDQEKEFKKSKNLTRQKVKKGTETVQFDDFGFPVQNQLEFTKK